MTRSFAMACLAVALLVGGSACNNDEPVAPTAKGAGAPVAPKASAAPPPRALTSASPPPAVVPATPAIAPAPVASTPAPPTPPTTTTTTAAGAAPGAKASASTTASPPGAGGASGSGIAVVLLMLPGGEEPGARAALTYKVSLSPGTAVATIQLNDRPPVTAPVQRIYPTPTAPNVTANGLAILRSVNAVPPPARPRAAMPQASRLNAPLDDGYMATDVDPRAWPGRRPSAGHGPSKAESVLLTSANGAPIIE